ncbi:MAG: hypothetical protein ACKPJJ_05170, partial [Planctomycetaceae bacterium]
RQTAVQQPAGELLPRHHQSSVRKKIPGQRLHPFSTLHHHSVSNFVISKIAFPAGSCCRK